MQTPSLRSLHEMHAYALKAYSQDRLSIEQMLEVNSDLWANSRGTAAMAQYVAWLAVQAWREHIPSLATRDGLALWCLNNYGFSYKGAAPARGQVVVWYNQAQAGDTNILVSNAVRSTRGIVYPVRYPLVIPAGDIAKHIVVIESQNAGAGQNADWGEITAWESPPNAYLQVSNLQDYEAEGASRIAGSCDEETRESLLERARLYPQACARGIEGAIEFGALSVTGVARANCTVRLQDDGMPGGMFWLYVADEAGMASPQLIAAVQAEVGRRWCAKGVIGTYLGGTPAYVPIIIRPNLRYGQDLYQARRNIIEALVRVGSRQGPNQTLLHAALKQALRRVPQIIVDDGTLVSPIGDVQPAAYGQVLAIRDVDITFQPNVQTT